LAIGAAIFVGAKIAVVAQELVDQIAVGGMDLNAVEPGLHGVACRMPVLVKQRGNFVQAQRARLRIWLPAVVGVSLAGRGRRGRRNRRLAAEVARMHQPAHVPKLAKNAPTSRVHRLRHVAPSRDLLRQPDPRPERPAEPLPADAGSFRNDQPGGGALSIILRHKRRRNVVARVARARQRRHQDAVRCVDRAEGYRVV
jgi:hypothetical protein